MSAHARPLEWVGKQPARTRAARPELRPVPDRDDAAALRGPGRLLFVQQQLNGAATVPELLGRASDLARGECGFDRAIILTVEVGALRADRLRALEDPAGDRLREQLVAEPLELRPGSAEAEFIRLVESGRGEF